MLSTQTEKWISYFRITLQFSTNTAASGWFSPNACPSGSSYSISHFVRDAPDSCNPSDKPPQPAKISRVARLFSDAAAFCLSEPAWSLSQICFPLFFFEVGAPEEVSHWKKGKSIGEPKTESANSWPAWKLQYQDHINDHSRRDDQPPPEDLNLEGFVTSHFPYIIAIGTLSISSL